MVRDGERPTGFLVRDVWVGRPIQVPYYRAGSAGTALCPADVDTDYVGDARILHLTGITPILSDSAWAATRAVLAAARDAETTVIFDPNLRRSLCSDEVAIPRLRKVVQGADVVLAGADELLALTGQSDLEGAARRLLADAPGLVVAKQGLGAHGHLP